MPRPPNEVIIVIFCRIASLLNVVVLHIFVVFLKQSTIQFNSVLFALNHIDRGLRLWMHKVTFCLTIGLSGLQLNSHIIVCYLKYFPKHMHSMHSDPCSNTVGGANVDQLKVFCFPAS